MTSELAQDERFSAPSGDALLTVKDVYKHFEVHDGRLIKRDRPVLKAVDGVSLEVRQGETLGLVGETGCGKSTLARCMTRLYELTSGWVEFDGHDISRMGPRELRPIRRDIQMIFQDPYGSLNPRRRVGSIIGDPFTIHKTATRRDKLARVQELMELVGLNPEHYNRFPAEFSGGQRQRIGVARALALKPKLIVCDEPVSALDVSIQAQVINLLADLQHEFGLTYVFISHDLSVVRHVSTRIAVMYLGKIVELGDADDIFDHTRHPYSKALLSVLPVPDPDEAAHRERIVLAGDVPSPLHPPQGCRFNPRCPKAQDVCGHDEPLLTVQGIDPPTHRTACHFPVADGERLESAAVITDEEIEALSAAESRANLDGPDASVEIRYSREVE